MFRKYEAIALSSSDFWLVVSILLGWFFGWNVGMDYWMDFWTDYWMDCWIDGCLDSWNFENRIFKKSLLGVFRQFSQHYVVRTWYLLSNNRMEAAALVEKLFGRSWIVFLEDFFIRLE